jgi:hypothetical protein
LVDNQLPAALARFLASRGVECQHVLELDLAESTDFTAAPKHFSLQSSACGRKLKPE